MKEENKMDYLGLNRKADTELTAVVEQGPAPSAENLNKLDGQGKARREAARRRNSECKINLNSRNFSRSNGSRPTAVQRTVIGRRRGAEGDSI